MLDAGDALLPTRALTTGGSPQTLAKADTIIRAQGLMGLDAMAVGEVELAIGLKRLQAIAREAKVPLLGANLVNARGKSPFEPRLLLQRAGTAVGVFAVLELPVGHKQHLLPLRQAKLKTTDAVVAAKAQISALRQEGAEIIVMIAHTGMKRARTLALQVPGVHVVLVAHSGQRHSSPIRVGDAFLMEAGRRGRDLGHLQLRLGRSWSADKKLTDDSRRHTLYGEIMLEVKKVKDSMKKSSVARSGTRSIKQYQHRVERANKLALQLERLTPPRTAHSLITTLLPLDETWADQPAVKALLDASKAKWTPSRPRARGPRINRPRAKGPRINRPHARGPRITQKKQLLDRKFKARPATP